MTETPAVQQPSPVKPGVTRALRYINVLTILGGLFLLVSSLWSGFGLGCFILLLLPLIAMLGIAWLVATIVWTTRGDRTVPGVRQLLVAPVIVCLTLALLYLYIPRRIAFAAHRRDFMKHVTHLGISTSHEVRWIGIYRVDAYVTDPRGGTYFRTGSTQDGIGPDTVSYGFVYQPNAEGSPFGRAGYQLHPLGDDWYWFRASNDF